MRILIFLFITLSMAGIIYSQEYGHKVYSVPPYSLNPVMFMEWEERYLIPVIYISDTSTLITIDENGDNRIDYDYTNSDFSTAALTTLNNKLYAYAKNRNLENDLRIMSLNSDFSINWTDSFQVSEDYSFPAGMKTLDNHLYTIAINERNEPLHRNINIKKIDTLGNEIWSKNYNTDYYLSYPWQTIVTQDGNLLVSVGLKHTTPGGFPRHSQLIKLNSNGDIIWDVEGNKAFSNGATNARLLQLNDGTIVQLYEIDRSLDSDFLWEGWFQEPLQIDFYNPSGQLVHEKLIKYTNEQWMVSTAVEAGHGDYFFFAGTLRILETTDNYATLIKFDSQGDTIWAKSYQHPEYTATNSTNHIKDIIELDNGDLVTIGFVNEPGSRYDVWLMRLNEHGCFGTPTCDEVITLTDDLLLSDNPVQVYPNPTSEKLHISSAKPIIKYEWYDMNGRNIRTDEGREMVENNVLDTSGLVSGQYVLLMYLDDGTVVTEMVIIK